MVAFDSGIKQMTGAKGTFSTRSLTLKDAYDQTVYLNFGSNALHAADEVEVGKVESGEEGDLFRPTVSPESVLCSETATSPFELLAAVSPPKKWSPSECSFPFLLRPNKQLFY